MKYSRQILNVSEDGGTVALDYYCDETGQVGVRRLKQLVDNTILCISSSNS